MRIVIDLIACQTSSSRNRGIGRYSMSLVKKMLEIGVNHEFYIILDGSFENTIDKITDELSNFLDKSRFKIYKPSPFSSEISINNSLVLEFNQELREIFINSLNPDAILQTSLFEATAQSSKSIPTSALNFTILYDLIPLLNKERYLTNPGAMKWYFGKLQSLVRNDFLLAISESSRQEAIEALSVSPDRVINISSAIEPTFRLIDISESEKQIIMDKYAINSSFILYTGGIDYRKNIEGLIEAYSLLDIDIRKNHQLVVVCSIHDTDRARLMDLAKVNGLMDREIIFTGFITDDDLLFLYNMCHLFVFPSIHEGFGLPALEAMACGAPVIVSNTSSLPEVVNNPIALFDPAEPQEIAKKMWLALTDSDFRLELSQHGLIQATKFSWGKSARTALVAIEDAFSQKSLNSISSNSMQQRLKLAFVAPLPPLRTGIAVYCTDLLPSLSRHYDIDVIVNQDVVDDSWISANFQIRSVDWFRQNHSQFDRVLYHFGNSAFHVHMPELLIEIPGVVVAHDFFLSGMMHWMHAQDSTLDEFGKLIFENHGYQGIKDISPASLPNFNNKYPMSKTIFSNAYGTIAHSDYLINQAKTWFGLNPQHFRKILLARKQQMKISTASISSRNNKQTSKIFTVCCFGFLGATKLNHKLLEAWFLSSLASDQNCQLIFIGELPTNDYGKQLEELMATHPEVQNIVITGFVSVSEYQDYLANCDCAVQLRTLSRGETSGAVFDCLGAGIPLIVNANGTFAELPANTTLMLDDDFSIQDLVDALYKIKSDPQLRDQISQQGQAFVRTECHPERIAQEYADAIEHFYQKNPFAQGRYTLEKLGKILQSDFCSPIQKQVAVDVFFANLDEIEKCYIDLTHIVETQNLPDQQMLSLLLDTFLLHENQGIVFVVFKNDRFVYAHEAVLKHLNITDINITNDTVYFKPRAPILLINPHYYTASQSELITDNLLTSLRVFMLTSSNLDDAVNIPSNIGLFVKKGASFLVMSKSDMSRIAIALDSLTDNLKQSVEFFFSQELGQILTNANLIFDDSGFNPSSFLSKFSSEVQQFSLPIGNESSYFFIHDWQTAQWKPNQRFIFAANSPQLSSQIGIKTDYAIQSTQKSGFVIYGPYISISAGQFKARIFASFTSEINGIINFDVISFGGQTHNMLSFNQVDLIGANIIEIPFNIQAEIHNLEVRMWIAETVEVTIFGMSIEREDISIITEKGLGIEK